MKYFLLIFALLFGYVVNAQEPRLVLPIGHTNGITSAQFSPDGKKVITNRVSFWDVYTGKGLYDIVAKGGLRFSNSGKLLAVPVWDSTADIIEISTGKVLQTLRGHLADIEMVSFSKDDKFLATASNDSTVKIWDVLTGKNIKTLIPKEKWEYGEVKFVGYSPNGKYLLSATESATFIWDAQTGILLLKTYEFTPKLTGFNFSPDGEKIIVSTNNKLHNAFNSEKEYITSLWDLNTHKIIFSNSNISPSANFSKDGKFILSVIENDSIAKIWSSINGTLVDSIKEENKKIVYAKFSPNNEKVLIISSDSIVSLINLKEKKRVFSLPQKLSRLSDYDLTRLIDFSADEKKIITSSEYNCYIWNSNSGNLISSIGGHTESTEWVELSKGGKHILTYSPKAKYKLWNSSTMMLIRTINSGINLKISSNSQFLFHINNDYTEINISETETGKILHTIPIDSNYEYDHFTSFSPNGQFLLKVADNYGYELWSLKPKNAIKIYEERNEKISIVKYSPNGKYLFVFYEDGIVKILNGVTLKQIKFINIKKKISYSSFPDIDPSEKYFAIIPFGNERSCEIWNIETGQLHKTIKGIHFHDFEEDRIDGYKNVRFSPTGKYFITTSDRISEDTLKVWETSTGMNVLKNGVGINNLMNIIFTKKDKNILMPIETGETILYDLIEKKRKFTIPYNPKTIDINYKNNQIFLSGHDGRCMVFHVETGEHLYTFFALDSSDFFIQIPSKYYMCSQSSPKLLHYVTKDLKVITFEQLDVKYNRPDKVLEAIGSTDTALINSYRKAYQKRIKKLGIDTTQFKDGYSVPESDFINRDAIEYEQTKDKLTLKIKAIDSTYKLDRFNVWVNEVPLFGLRGVKTKGSNNFDTTITITLSQGENRIETSVINVNGTESYKMPLFVKYTPAKPIEEKQYFIGIGINQFANPDYNLSWSVKDIRDLALKLKTKYPNIIIDTLFDNNVTKENVLALKQKLLQLKEDDKVIVSYSGHGVLSKDFDYYLSTYSINFNNPAEKGLAYDDVESLLDNIKPRKKLMLIDACHSGEVDKDEIAKIEASKKSMDSMGVQSKSTIKIQPKKNLGMANSFELMQNLFVNVGKGTGATIISAAGGMQYAQERGDLKNGVFTYSLIEAFNQNQTLKVSELKKKVGERVTQLTNGLQKPTSRNETNNYDWVIW